MIANLLSVLKLVLWSCYNFALGSDVSTARVVQIRIFSSLVYLLEFRVFVMSEEKSH